MEATAGSVGNVEDGIGMSKVKGILWSGVDSKDVLEDAIVAAARDVAVHNVEDTVVWRQLWYC